MAVIQASALQSEKELEEGLFMLLPHRPFTLAGVSYRLPLDYRPEPVAPLSP